MIVLRKRPVSRARRGYRPRRARPEGLQGVRRARALPDGARRGRRVRDRPRLRRAVRAEADRRRPRHAAVVARRWRAAVREGAADGGADVLDIGMVGTEMVYFAVGELELDGGIAVTASHNPKEYTGMKIVRARRAAGRRRVRAARRARPCGRGAVARRASAARSATRTSGTASSTACCRSSTSSALRPLRVVIDAANGMAGAMLPPVLERLPMLDVVRCYFEPDGSFPNHEPNPLLPENREFIIAQDDARRAPTSASPTTATPTAASSSTTRATSCPATSRRRCSRELDPRRGSRAAR